MLEDKCLRRRAKPAHLGGHLPFTSVGSTICYAFMYASSWVKTYEEAGQAVEQLCLLPLSGLIPGHPSLDSITEPAAWHTGTDTDPWHWQDRFASEGITAYGRFIGSRPILIAREVFPLLKCLLASSQTVQERYAAALLARSTVRIYEIIRQNRGIEVRALRKLAGMQGKADKNAFDHALIDLQNTADIVISGWPRTAMTRAAKVAGTAPVTCWPTTGWKSTASHRSSFLPPTPKRNCSPGSSRAGKRRRCCICKRSLPRFPHNLERCEGP
jgi:hypothetical protein